MTEKKRLWISLEGVIGGGKTTWLENVLPHLPSGIVKMDEPVALWQSSGMLEKSYSEPATWGFPAQLHFLSTRLDEHRRAVATNPAADIFISERSPFTDKIFWNTNLDTGRISRELDPIYLDLWRHWQQCVAPWESPSYFIFLDVPVDVCLARIDARKRSEEKEIERSYIETLHEYHCQFFGDPNGVLMPNGDRVPVIRIDGSVDFRRQDVARDVARQVREQINWG